MEVSKGNVRLFHFGLKTSLENPLALSLLQRIYLKQDFQDEVLVDEWLAVFDIFFVFQNIFDPLHNIVFIGEQFFSDYFESFA